MNILLNGAAGFMGREVIKALSLDGCEDTLCACVDLNVAELSAPAYTRLSDVRERADVIVDFSHHAATKDLLSYALDRRIPVVIATTGQTALSAY